MAQQGNDNAKEGLVTNHPVWNVHQGVYAGGDNFTPLSFATKEDGYDDRDVNGPNRDQARDPERMNGWVLTPGLE